MPWRVRLSERLGWPLVPSAPDARLETRRKQRTTPGDWRAVVGGPAHNGLFPRSATSQPQEGCGRRKASAEIGPSTGLAHERTSLQAEPAGRGELRHAATASRQA